MLSPNFSLALRQLVRRLSLVSQRNRRTGSDCASGLPVPVTCLRARSELEHASDVSGDCSGSNLEELRRRRIHTGGFSRFETPGSPHSRIGTAKYLRARELMNVPNWHPPCIQQREAKNVVAYLHRNHTTRGRGKRSSGTTASTNRVFQAKQTLSKRRGRSLVSSNQRQYFSDDCRPVVASALSNRRAPSPLVRYLYESET